MMTNSLGESKWTLQWSNRIKWYRYGWILGCRWGNLWRKLYDFYLIIVLIFTSYVFHDSMNNHLETMLPYTYLTSKASQKFMRKKEKILFIINVITILYYENEYAFFLILVLIFPVTCFILGIKALQSMLPSAYLTYEPF